MASRVPAHDKISKDEFQELLVRYPALIETISDAKPAKAGQKTLKELDNYRYIEAISLFGDDDSRREMELDDVKTLVEWKLRHGKFRPTLMSLITSNSDALTKTTIQTAIAQYRTTSSTPGSLATLTKLKGVGPATASLLLTVHYPSSVLFFSDEAFYWLCCKGKKAPLKYNAKEYEALRSEAEGLVARLGVSATDVEKVAYVVMKEQNGETEAKKPVIFAKVTKVTSEAMPKSSAAKRQIVTARETAEKEDGPVRRSKRLKS